MDKKRTEEKQQGSAYW